MVGRYDKGLGSVQQQSEVIKASSAVAKGGMRAIKNVPAAVSTRFASHN
jgi:hypothetical protein